MAAQEDQSGGTLTDEELVRACRSGDEAALEVLLARYQEKLRRLALAQLRPKRDFRAEDDEEEALKAKFEEDLSSGALSESVLRWLQAVAKSKIQEAESETSVRSHLKAAAEFKRRLKETQDDLEEAEEISRNRGLKIPFIGKINTSTG
jgi:septal ring factor EnvC (AmiA/AmiB activator)